MSKKKNTDSKSNSGVDLLDREKHDLKPPSKYNVVFYNDNYTPMDFVWAVLMKVFHLGAQAAYKVMILVHESGKGIAGTYPKGIAATKAKQVMDYAKEAGHPLLCKIEKT
jgi:ATP-dependent Clp protease adaptor protein ClpS